MSADGEYIKLLSVVADNDDPPYWFKGRDAKRDTLLVELKDAGFLRAEFCEGSVMAYITYKGRLELKRLQEYRHRQMFETCLKWASIVVAIATAISAVCAVVACCHDFHSCDKSAINSTAPSKGAVK